MGANHDRLLGSRYSRFHVQTSTARKQRANDAHAGPIRTESLDAVWRMALTGVLVDELVALQVDGEAVAHVVADRRLEALEQTLERRYVIVLVIHFAAPTLEAVH